MSRKERSGCWTKCDMFPLRDGTQNRPLAEHPQGHAGREKKRPSPRDWENTSSKHKSHLMTGIKMKNIRECKTCFREKCSSDHSALLFTPNKVCGNRWRRKPRCTSGTFFASSRIWKSKRVAFITIYALSSLCVLNYVASTNSSSQQLDNEFEWRNINLKWKKVAMISFLTDHLSTLATHLVLRQS